MMNTPGKPLKTVDSMLLNFAKELREIDKLALKKELGVVAESASRVQAHQAVKSDLYQLMLSLVDGLQHDDGWIDREALKVKLSEHFNVEGEASTKGGEKTDE